MSNVLKKYEIAKEEYGNLGVDTDAAIKALNAIPISMHCWQGDDVGGFESSDIALSGGIQAIGNYPGKASTPTQLRQDIDMALSMIPGTHRLNLHAMYAETEGKVVERDALEPKHFANWVSWAKKNNMGLDFNPTYFSHPLADDGLTLSHPDEAIRKFWIDHSIACRKISEYFGKELGTPSVNNIWIPDGYKDVPANRLAPRQRLKDALDVIFAEDISKQYNLDAIESKLFGLGSESYVTGSHEFYMGYAVANKKVLALDTGHFHPTETVSNKISAIMLFVDELLLHVSRPVRWDSDHVVTFDDELREIAHELIRGDFLGRTHIGLDFFDASILRIAAWVIGTRNMQKALLYALLEPTKTLQNAELTGDFTTRLAMFEELKTMPWAAVWDYYCDTMNVPTGLNWLPEVRKYEDSVLSLR